MSLVYNKGLRFISSSFSFHELPGECYNPWQVRESQSGDIIAF